MGLMLREVRHEDLPVLFEQWADPVAAHMAAFTAPDHMDRDAFERRWSRLRADETVLTTVIVGDDDACRAPNSHPEPTMDPNDANTNPSGPTSRRNLPDRAACLRLVPIGTDPAASGQNGRQIGLQFCLAMPAKMGKPRMCGALL